MADTQQIIRGTGVSTGIAQGTAYVLTSSGGMLTSRRDIEEADVEAEIARFDGAVDQAERELLALQNKVAERLGPSEAGIFAAQAMVVRDHALQGPVLQLIRRERINAEGALIEVMDRFTRTFEAIPDDYMRERAADVRDVGRRILEALVPEGERVGPLDVPAGSILVTDELLPSATARLEFSSVRGFITEKGGKFSHTAILARSMRTPAITGAAGAVRQIRTGDRLIVDAMSGVVFINPGDRARREYDRLEGELRGYNDQLKKLVEQPSVTRDGVVIPLLANVSKFSDTEAAFLYRADGIGLYRTEFGFLMRSAFPTEDEQVEFLKRAAARFQPRKVVLRLLDIGGDKHLPYFRLPASRNPSLAQRGIRLLLRNRDILKRQLRAFLRISADHPVAILLPVVGGPQDVRDARAVMQEVQEEMTADGQPFNPRIPFGAMIEVPSAALMTPALAREVDFLSLGTNDLVQYVLAADREDESVADDYQPMHPAVLRLIAFVADSARQANCPLSICGEIAGDPAWTELLVGLGLRELSVAPGELLEVKNAVRNLTVADARACAQEAIELSSASEVQALLERRRASSE